MYAPSHYYAHTYREAIEIYKHHNNFYRKGEGVKLDEIWTPTVHQHIDDRLLSIRLALPETVPQLTSRDGLWGPLHRLYIRHSLEPSVELPLRLR